MSDERDLEAAEYVLGTLPADERARVAARVAGDPALAAEIRGWEARLAPLAASAPEVALSPHLWDAISRATQPAASTALSSGADIVQLRRRVSVWRSTAIGAMALAAGFAIVAIIDRESVPLEPAGQRYVAVVNADGAAPAMIAEVDTASATIRIRSLAAEVPAGKSLEVWHIPDGQPAVSLGIINAGMDDASLQKALARGPVNGLIAVTLEPEGGSPAGVATGPVVYSGTLVPIEPASPTSP